MRPDTATLLVILMAAALAGCATAEHRYEQGLELEDAGQAAGAARRYVEALRKDPTLADARERLEVSGRAAIAAHLGQARQDRLRGDAAAEAESYLAAEGVVVAARSVQVTLPVPPRFAAERDSALARAVSSLTDGAARLAAGGRWPEALERLDETARFRPSTQDTATIAGARLDILTRWGQAEMAAGRHRSALALAEQGLELARPGTRDHARLQSMQRDAVRLASVRVVFLPLTGHGHPPAERAFIADVNDALELAHWLDPPVLIAPVDPREVRRAAGRALRAGVDAESATRLARRLRADYVVISAFEELTATDSGIHETPRTARTRRGAAVSYTERSGTRRLRAGAGFRVLPASGPTRSATIRVRASRTFRFTETDHAGDPGDLKLTARQARAFTDDGAAEQRRLTDELAARLSERMFEVLLEGIP